MKLNFTLTALNEVVEVDGSVDEISALIRNLAAANVSARTTPRTAVSTASTQVIGGPSSTSTASVKKTKQRALKTTHSFVEAIYLYEPNPAADSGRGAYIATQIVKGKSLNIDDLAKRAQGRRQTVYNAVRRMRDNGAVIEMTSTHVKLISLPEPPYEAKSYAMDNRGVAIKPAKATPKNADAGTDTAAKLLSSLSNIRLG